MATIGIFPAAGALGSSVYTHLLTTCGFPASRLVLICRHPSKIPAQFIAAGATARQASYESSATDLAAAFAGVDVLLLISYPSHVRDYRVEVQIPALDAAVLGVGVGHVVYASLAFAGAADQRASVAEVMQAHLATEQRLRELAEGGAATAPGRSGGGGGGSEGEEADERAPPGFSYTVVREGLYAESFPIYLAFWDPSDPAQREIRIPDDGTAGRIAWAKRDELGEATARLLAGCCCCCADATALPAAAAAAAAEAAGEKQQQQPLRRHTNQTLVLTGPAAWTLADTVALLGRLAGRPPGEGFGIRRCSVDEYATQPRVLARFGGSAQLAHTWATAWEAVRRGETAVVTPTLAEVLGRQPSGLEDALRGVVPGQAGAGKT